MTETASPRSTVLRVAIVIALAGSMGMPVKAYTQITRPEPAKQAAYLELGGPGGLLSANYESYLNERFSARGGAAWWSFTNLDNFHQEMTAAIGSVSARWDVSDFAGQGDGRFVEAGLAATVGTYSQSRYGTLESEGGFLTLVPMAGLRYQLPQGGWMFRATFTPYVPLIGSYVPLGEGKAKHAINIGASFSGGYAF